MPVINASISFITDYVSFVKYMKIAMRKLERKVGIIILVLLSFFITENITAQGYDSTYVLSIKQKFAIPEDVINGDHIGNWKKTVTWRSGNSISYGIQANYKTAFSINSSTGLITITDASKIYNKVIQQDTIINLIIRTRDSGLGFEDDTCEIRVKENKYCVFFDYNYTGSESGSRANPYNNFSDVAVKAGYGYFFKRGNKPVGKKYDIYGFQATALHPTILSAYSSGNNPSFDGTGLGSGNTAFVFKNTPAPSKFCYVYNIDVKNYPSMAFRVYTRSSNFGFYNCNFNRNMHIDYGADLADIFFFGTAADTLISYKHELINLESAASVGPILKSDCSGISAYNIKSATSDVIPGKGMNFRYSISYYSTLSHFWFVGAQRSLQVRYPNNVITDGVITGSKEAGMFLITDVTYNGKLKNLKINNVLFKNNPYGIYGYDIKINGTTIENCRFESNSIDGINFRNGGDSRTIRYCSFINNANDGIELSKSSQSSTNLTIVYNIFYGNKGKALNASTSSCASNVNIYNNTIIGAVDLSGSTNEVVRNNFCESLSSATTSSNNIILSTISQSTYFKSPSTKNYQLLSTAVNAINKGVDVGLKYDLMFNSLSGLPDIGAFEYKSVAMSFSNNAPEIIDQSFVINADQFKDNIVGKIMASDSNAEQELSYSIISGNDNGLFRVDNSTGDLYTTTSNIFTADSTSIQLVVKVTDNGSNPISSTGTINVTLIGKETGVISGLPEAEQSSSNTINIYPNPSKGMVNVEIDLNNSGKADSQKDSEIEIFDVSGKNVLSTRVSAEETLVQGMDLSDMPNGLYFVRITKGNTVMSDKLILNK